MERGKLPENVVIEILLRLPVKSLLRFKSICKAWYALIKNPNFISKHLHLVQALNSNTYNNIYVSFLGQPRDDVLSIETSLDLSSEINLELTGPIEIEGCCNGIVCISSHHGDIYLLNPATRQLNCLPTPPSLTYPTYLHSYKQEIALGFDPKINNYKVVRFVTIEDFNRQRQLPSVVQIYTQNSESWRETELVVPARIASTYKPRLNTYIDGVFYWLALAFQGNIILSFDMSNEVFGTTPPLPDFLFKEHCCDLTLLNGCFAMICGPRRYDREPTKYFEIWVTTTKCKSIHVVGEAESWVKQFTVGPFSEINEPLAILDDKLFLENLQGELIKCDLRTHETKNLQLYRKIHPSRVAIYKESLVSTR